MKIKPRILSIVICVIVLSFIIYDDMAAQTENKTDSTQVKTSQTQIKKKKKAKKKSASTQPANQNLQNVSTSNVKTDTNTAAIKLISKDTTIAVPVLKKDSVIIPLVLTPKESLNTSDRNQSDTIHSMPSKSGPVDSVTLKLMVMSERLKKAKLKNLDWIAGEWESRDRQSTFEEYWARPLGNSMIGISREVADNKLTSFEYLRLMQTDSGVVYILQPSDRAAMEFKLVELGDEQATFANSLNSFPQRILFYKEANNTLSVRLEGMIGDQRISKNFRYRCVKN